MFINIMVTIATDYFRNAPFIVLDNRELMSQKIICLLIFMLLGAFTASVAQGVPELKVELGQTLFFDQSISLNRNLSCATCHNPTAAFTDPRANKVESAASMGTDLSSIEYVVM